MPDAALALARLQRPVVRALLRAPPPIARRIARRRLEPVDGCQLDLQIAVLLALDDIAKESDLRGFEPVAARRRIALSIAKAERPRRSDVSMEEGELASAAGPLLYRRYQPAGLSTPSPLVFFVHGGGWVVGSVSTHDSFCGKLAAEARCQVVSLEYRLAPETPFPAAVEDCVAGFRAIAARCQEFGVDHRRIAVMGDSAGGNLSAVVARRTLDDRIRPALQVLIYPATDASRSLPSQQLFAEGYYLTRPMIDWYYAHYLGARPESENPDVSPLFGVDSERLPPAHVYTAGFDPLRDEGQAYAERLRQRGVAAEVRCFDDLIHGFALMGGLVDAAAAAVSEIFARTRQALHAEPQKPLAVPDGVTAGAE